MASQSLENKVLVKRLDALSEVEIQQWRAFQQADTRLSSPFLAPELAIAYARHNESARVAVISDGATTLGFFPFEMRKFGVARSLGYDLTDVQALICDSDFEWDMHQLLHQCEISVFEFDHWAPHQATVFAAKHVEVHPAPVIDTSMDWDSWVADRRKHSSSRMKKAFQRKRGLEREYETLALELTKDPADLDLLMEWKAQQYVRTGRSDRFAHPWFRKFIHEMFSVPTDEFALELHRLRAGDRTIALYLSFVANNIRAGWFPTHDVAEHRHSPGLVCLLMLVEQTSEAGISRFDLGEGEADYKETFKNGDDEVAEGWCELPSAQALFYRARTTPRRVATNIVLGNPRLRKAARETLKRVGAVRQTISSRRPG